MATKSDSLPEGTEDAATSEGSHNGSNQEGRSAAQYVTVEDFQRIQQSLEAVRRQLQSGHDKGVKKLDQRVEGIEQNLKSLLQNASRSGQSVDELLGQLEAEEEREAREATLEIARALREGRFPAAGSGGTGQQTGVDVSAVLTELEMDESDTRVQDFRAKKFTSEAEAYREAAKLLKKIQSTQPDDADTPSPESRTRQGKPNQAQLMQEYQRRSAPLHGQALLRLKKEMRDKGLEIS